MISTTLTFIESAPPPSAPSVSLEDLLRTAEQEIGETRVREVRVDMARALTETAGAPSLRSLRLAQGLTQAEAAAALRTSQPYMAALENGKIKNPGKSRLSQLADLYGVSFDIVVSALDAED